MKQLLTHSRMQSFKTCRKKAFFEYEIGIRKEIDAKALRMGSAGHDGLDILKQGLGIEAAIEKVRSHYLDRPDNYDDLEWEYERETVECLVSGYHWRWGDAFQVVETEQSFRVPIRNPATGHATPIWDAAGKIDGVIHLEDGRMAVLEHKFISDDIGPDSDYWPRLQLDHQITYYVWAARQLGHAVESVLYDVVRKPTIKPTQVPLLDENGLKVVLDEDGNRVINANGKPRLTGDTAKGYVLQSRPMTPEEWGEKLLEDIGKRPDFYYARREIARLDSDIAEMLDEVWDIQQTIRDAQQKGRWFKTVSKDTCTWCSFFGLCSSRFDPADGTPEGFIRLENLHPELEETPV